MLHARLVALLQIALLSLLAACGGGGGGAAPASTAPAAVDEASAVRLATALRALIAEPPDPAVPAHAVHEAMSDLWALAPDALAARATVDAAYARAVTSMADFQALDRASRKLGGWMGPRAIDAGAQGGAVKTTSLTGVGNAHTGSGVTVIFINGVGVDEGEYEYAVEALRKVVAPVLPLANVRGVYNVSATDAQRSYFGDFFCPESIEPAPSPLRSLLDGACDLAGLGIDVGEAVRQWANFGHVPTVGVGQAQQVADAVKEEIARGQKVVLLPHSQGNFFARDALWILGDIASHERIHVGVLMTGSPLHSGRMASALDGDGRVRVVRNADDRIADLSIEACESTCVPSPVQSGGFLGLRHHYFLEGYLAEGAGFTSADICRRIQEDLRTLAATLLPGSEAPNASDLPGDLEAFAWIGCDGAPTLRVAWTPSDRATSYEVFVDDLSATGLLEATRGGYTRRNIQAPAIHRVFVRARNDRGFADSATLIVPISENPCGSLPAPAMLLATSECRSGSPAVRLQWLGAAGASAYRVLRDGDPKSLLPATAREFVDGPLSPGNLHEYVVRAIGPSGFTDSATSVVRVTADNCSASAPATPDLAVENLRLSAASVAPGAVLNVSFEVRNRGSAQAAGSTAQVRLGSSSTGVSGLDPLLGSVPTPSLAPGDVQAHTLSVTVPSASSGNLHVWAIADAGGTSGQRDASNDRASGALRVGSGGSGTGAADLVVSTLTLGSTSGKVGASILVTLAVRNQGSAASKACTTNLRLARSSGAVTVADPLLASVSTPVVGAGATVTLTSTVRIPDVEGGAAFVWAIADVNDVAGQSDTSNDKRSTPFTVSASSDLVVQSISASPTSGGVGSSTTLTVVVKNQGVGRSSACTTNLRLAASSGTVATTDPLLASVSTPVVLPGASTTLTKSVTVPSVSTGTRYAWAIADVSNVAQQTDYGNDKKSCAFTVTSGADLIVQSLSVSPTSAKVGGSVTVTVTIKNQGGSSSKACTTNLRMAKSSSSVSTSDPLLASLSTGAVAAGATTTLTKSVTVPDQGAGSCYIWAIADVNSQAGQSDETNDKKSVAFTVKASSDLIVQSISVSPASGKAGSKPTVTVVIKNQGTGSSSSCTTNLRFAKSSSTVTTSDTLLVGLSTPAISPGATKTLTYTVTIPSASTGTWYVWAIADVNSTAQQTNETNDKKNIAFTVTS